MHDEETIFHLSYVLTASGNLFRNMSDARETAISTKLQFHGHHSYFRKDFQMLLTLKEGYT